MQILSVCNTEIGKERVLKLNLIPAKPLMVDRVWCDLSYREQGASRSACVYTMKLGDAWSMNSSLEYLERKYKNN